MRDLRGRRAFGALAFAVVLGGGLSACGGDDDPFADEEIDVPIRGGLDNEEVLADPDTVVEGLTTIKQMITELVPKIGSEDAIYDNEAILPIWEDVEGRVKIDDSAAHERLEVAFIDLAAAVDNKDKTAGSAAADTIIREIDAYLAKPRTASPTPSPSSTSIAPTSIPTPSLAPESTSATPTSTPSSISP